MALSTLSIPFATSGVAVSAIFSTPTPALVLPNIPHDGIAHVSLTPRGKVIGPNGEDLGDTYGDYDETIGVQSSASETSPASKESSESVFVAYTDTMPPPESSTPLSTGTQTTSHADVQDAAASSTTPPIPGKTYVSMSDIPNDTSTTTSAFSSASTSTDVNYPSSISVAPSLSSAYSCLSSWNVYEAGFTTWVAETTIEPTLSVQLSSVKNPPPASLHTLCDQVPRGPSNYSEYSTWSATSTLSPAWTGVTNVSTNTITATPTCSVPGNECFDLASDFSYFTTMTSPNNSSFINPDVGPCKNYGNCERCQIRARSVELFYWPVATGTPLCAGDEDQSTAAAATITPAPNPSTIVTRGYTMTWPSVYLSIDYILGLSPKRDSQGRLKHLFCGQPTSNLMVPIPPESLSSIRTIGKSGDEWVSVTSSFDFADLNTVPADVYRGMSKCWTDTTTANLCSTIYDDYAPRLVIPDAVRSIVPMWQNCDPCLEGVIDPPIALVSATDDVLVAEATPSSADAQVAFESTDGSLVPTTAVAAAAKQTSDSGLPKETAKATTDPSPSTESNDSDSGSDGSGEAAATTAPSNSKVNTKTAGVGSAIIAGLGGDPNPTGSADSDSGSSSDQNADGTSDQNSDSGSSDDSNSPGKNHGTAAQAVPVVVTYSSGAEVAVVTASLNGASLAEATGSAEVVLTYSSDGQEVEFTTTLDPSQVSEAAAAAVATNDSAEDDDNAQAAVPVTLTYSSNGQLATVTMALDPSQISEADDGDDIPVTLTYSSNGQLVTAITTLDASQVSEAAAEASTEADEDEEDDSHDPVPVTLTFSSNGHHRIVVTSLDPAELATVTFSSGKFLATITTSVPDASALPSASKQSSMRTSSTGKPRTTTATVASATNVKDAKSAAQQQRSGVVSVSTALLSLFLAGALMMW